MRFRPYASAMLKYWRTTKRPGYHGLQKMAEMARAVFLPDFRLQLYLGTYPYLSKGVFERRTSTSTKDVACERLHLCEFWKSFVGSARRLISKSNFCRGCFPFVTVTLTVRILRTRKGEKMRSCRVASSATSWVASRSITVTACSLPILSLVL